jgi:hypothetical protein
LAGALLAGALLAEAGALEAGALLARAGVTGAEPGTVRATDAVLFMACPEGNDVRGMRGCSTSCLVGVEGKFFATFASLRLHTREPN